MNLRPPGPQPERSRRIQCSSALPSDLSCSELRSVALNLHPRLHPVDRERSSSRALATHCSPMHGRISVDAIAREIGATTRGVAETPPRRPEQARAWRVGDARQFRGAAVLSPASRDRPLLRFVQGGSEHGLEPAAGERCSRRRAGAWTCTAACSAAGRAVVRSRTPARIPDRCGSGSARDYGRHRQTQRGVSGVGGVVAGA